MKLLFFSSLILPLAYFLAVLLFSIGLIFNFDIAEIIEPHNIGYRKPGLALNPAKWRKTRDEIVVSF